MKTILVTVLLLSGLATAEESVAAPAAAPEAAQARPPSLEISLKAGAAFPQLLSKLGLSFDTSLTVGYAPFSGHQLQFFIGLGYSQPAQTLSATDPRLGAAGGDYSSRLVMRDLSTSLGAKYFFLPEPSHFVVPYAGLGLRVHFLRADVSGSGGADFGKYNETDTRFGGVAFAGVGLHLGPGLVLGELAFDYAPISQRVTGEANVGALSVVLGYGLMLF